ncbi:MAG: hypothetical protein WAM60_04685, partial [Candidatus Promineifilaceae bacterium]
TLWGRFGFGQIPMPQIIYDGLLWLTMAGFVGAIIGFVRRGLARFFLFLLALDVALFMAVLFNYMLVSPAGPNGRFFFPGLAALAVLIAYGLGEAAEIFTQWRRIINRERVETVLAGLFGVGLAGLALVALFGYLAPAYARPPEIKEDAVIPNPIHANFDVLATLLGYEISSTAVEPGGYLDLSLYWQVNVQPPGDYYLFVHLIDETGTIIAQRDTHPGLGRFPTSQWKPGDRFIDTVRIYLSETDYAPSTATLSVGLYAPGGFRLGITGPDGQELGDALDLTPIQVVPKAGDYPNLQDQNFNDEIRLVGYEYNQRTAEAGSFLAVTLYWEALTDYPTDYIVQVRLLDENGDILAAADGPPQRGKWPTNTWQKGEIIEDTRQLLIEEQFPPGIYPVDVALFDANTEQRQNIVGEDGHWIDNHLFLAKVPVNLQQTKEK